MNAQPVLEKVMVDKKEDMFAEQVKQGKVEQYIVKHIQNNEISKERKDENEMLKEDIGNTLGPSIYPTVVELPDGQFGVVKVIEKKKQTLDKEALAQHVGIDKDEIKTPYDYAKLVEKGIISAEMIQGFMVEKAKLQVSIRKSKTNPLKNKNKKTANNS